MGSSKKYYMKNPWAISFERARQRCQKGYPYHKKGRKFLMSMADFKYLWFRDKAYRMKKPSIDRKDNKGHYTLKNCRYIEFAKNVSREHKGKIFRHSKETKEILRIKMMGNKHAQGKRDYACGCWGKYWKYHRYDKKKHCVRCGLSRLVG